MSTETSQNWDARVERLLDRLPSWLRASIRWLRMPAHRWVRRVVAVLLILGSLLFILPVFGLWMLPLGAALLAEDVPGLKSPLEKSARRLSRAWRRVRGIP